MSPPTQWDGLDVDQISIVAQKFSLVATWGGGHVINHSPSVGRLCRVFLPRSAVAGGVRSVVRLFREMRRRRKDGRLVWPLSNAFRTPRLSILVRELGSRLCR